MIFDKYPYTNFHEMNDDWVIQTLREFGQLLDDFVAANSLSYADPIEYNPDTIYPAHTVVIYNDTAYVSKQAIPAGMLPTVGGDYWLAIFPFGDLINAGIADMQTQIDAALAAANAELDAAISTLPAVVATWLTNHPDVTTTVQDDSITWTKLNNDLKPVLLAGYSESSVINIDAFEQGAIGITNGEDVESTFMCRTGFITFPKGITLIRTMQDLRIQVFKYALDGTFENRVVTVARLGYIPFVTDENHKYRISISYDDYSTLAPADLPPIPVVAAVYTSDSVMKSDLDTEAMSDIIVASTNKYPIAIGLWAQGTMRIDTGSLPSSNYACRTRDTISFTQSGFVKIVVPAEFKLTCNEYNDARGYKEDFIANVFSLKTGSFYVHVKSDKFYRLAISKTDNSELLLADLPQLPISVEFMQICDKLLDSVYCRKFNQDELEIGRYGIATASEALSSTHVKDVSGKQYTVLGIRSSLKNHGGILDNCDHIKTRGNIYMYAIGIDSTDGSVKGWYNARTGAWSTSTGDTLITSDLNIRAIKATGISVKVCFVDVSITTQLSISDAIEYIDVYYTPERSALADVCIEPQYYYEQMLAEKSNDILTAMETAGRNSFTFMYFTDPHWSNNAKQTPSLMKYISDNLGIDDVICGGDIVAGQGLVEYATSEILNCLRAFKNAGITFPVSCGNHDRNWNTANNQRDYPERRLSDNSVWALMESWYNKQASYFTNSGFNFYIDFEKSNTRTIFIDTGDDNTYAEWNAFADALMSAGDKNIVVFPHAVDVNNIGKNICNVCNSYNARQHHISEYLDYDFANAHGHVYIVIGGHGHSDKVVTPVAGGVSFVMCDTNSLSTHSEAGSQLGTVTEQAFDVVTIDYNTGTTYFTRIGRGGNREV